MEVGEVASARWAANRTWRKRGIGGWMFLTNQRLIFSPNVVDRLTGQKEWSCALADISTIETKSAALDKPLAGRLHQRLKVTLAEEIEELFVVKDPDEVISLLNEARK